MIPRRAAPLLLAATLAVPTACAGTQATAPAAAPTTVPPTTSAAAGITPGADPDVDAVVTAWTSVFGSGVPVADKLTHLAEPQRAEPVLQAYATAGEQVGGISLLPTAVTVTGESAEVTYDVLFGGTAAYSGQTGTVQRQDGRWVVDTEQFCSFMAAARTPCS